MLAIQLFFVAAVTAAPTIINHVLHEERQTPSSDWIKGVRIEGDAILPMRIGLTQSNLEKGHEFLMEVSSPDSPKYGQYWSADEVHAMFAPDEGIVKAVKEWLISSGIHDSRIVHSDNKGWLAFDASIEEAETLLLTEFYEHERPETSKIRVGCDKYHIPEHLVSHIDYITPGVKLTPVVKRSIEKPNEKRANSTPRGPKCVTTLNRTDGYPWDYQTPGAGNIPPSLRSCGVNMTQACYKALYSIPDPPQKVDPGNSLGLYEQGDYFSKEDLDLFYATYAPWIPQGTYPIPDLIDGANYSVSQHSSLNTGESEIDMSIAYYLLYPQTVTLYQVDDQLYEPVEVLTTNLFNTFLDALDGSYCTYSAYGETGDDPSIDPVYPDQRPDGYKGQLQCGIYKPTNVVSASYGQAEYDLPINYTKRQCNEFLKLGLQGHSILFASGDYGVASFPGDGGAANGCLGPEAKIFSPQYPGNCPYVTSVGGTMLYADQTIEDPESAMQVNLGGSMTNFSSAGGFSNYFPQPSYQVEAVEEYFRTANLSYPYYSEFSVDFNTTTGLYNRIGRGYPDVASNGAFLLVFVQGLLGSWTGTSLASPTFASILTLLNEERIAAGKSTVGFINPVLYANPGVLNDIVNGTNLGCGSNGFQAIKGWDPVTGLGTPNYPKMLELFMSLP